MHRARFRAAKLLVALTLSVCSHTFAQNYVELNNEFGSNDRMLEQAVLRDPQVKALAHDVALFKARLRVFKERDFVALFEKQTPFPPKTFALPSYEPRWLALSGKRYVDAGKNKDHTDFHIIGDVGGLQVYYGIDGATPVALIFYFRVDRDFPKLNTVQQLGKRVAWDRGHFQKLVQFFEIKRSQVFAWEVDPTAEKQWAAGDYLQGGKAKLAAWLASGKKLGYRLVIEPESNGRSKEWTWFGKSGNLVRSASMGPDPGKFIWYHDDGFTPRREETMGGFWITSWRWSRPDGTMIRYESANAASGYRQPSYWRWCDAKGNAIRHETDDNADGIPDWVSGDPKNKKLKALSIENSWAIHPELIAAVSRIPDQLGRRVPIRKTTVK